ncbi:hypothetical protein EVAR_91998_1 [Eumeta japonica]|uniref:Uncharacterized protein n=1 Tax=Eumeta variegata TaxID=151549 RepID=A0A4C1SHE1_EUMVA|nr:hypothetical protein EVAR_91998_1 [Eumeta japonica]
MAGRGGFDKGNMRVTFPWGITFVCVPRARLCAHLGVCVHPEIDVNVDTQPDAVLVHLLLALGDLQTVQGFLEVSEVTAVE